MAKDNILKHRDDLRIIPPFSRERAQKILDKIKADRKGTKTKIVQINHKTWKEIVI